MRALTVWSIALTVTMASMLTTNWLAVTGSADAGEGSGKICVIVDGEEVICIAGCLGPNIVTFDVVPNLGISIAGLVFVQPLINGANNAGVFVKVPTFSNTFVLVVGWTDGDCTLGVEQACDGYDQLRRFLSMSMEGLPAEAMAQEALGWLSDSVSLEAVDPMELHQTVLRGCG